MCIVIEKNESDMSVVGQVMFDKFFASRTDEVPMVSHVHRLGVFENNDILRNCLFGDCKSRNCEIY